MRAFLGMRTLALVLGCASPFACTYGGSDVDPREGFVAEPVETGDRAVSAAASEAPSPSAALDGGLASAEVDAGSLRDAAQGASCTPAAPLAACDPVHNEGCVLTLLVGLPTQCDLVPDAAVPAGRCVLPGVQSGTRCTSDELSTTCPAQSTCSGGTCRRMCYCDDDCDPGEACGDGATLGSSPVRLCRPR